MTNRDKLADLAEEYDTTPEELLQKHSFGDSGVPGICTNSSCSYTAEYEPDQRAGYCEECRTQTVVSAFVLAGLI